MAQTARANGIRSITLVARNADDQIVADEITHGTAPYAWCVAGEKKTVTFFWHEES